MFLIPYQWESAAGPSAASAVWLFVSKDHGATWQKISDARPHVKSFNYRAEGEGEYWFAIRTVDRQGRAWPAGHYQPELRVIVDTTMPRIDYLRASRRHDGSIDIQWRGLDANLDPSSWKIEAQRQAAAVWETVPITGASDSPPNSAIAIPNLQSPGGLTHTGQTAWQPPPGAPPIAIRATVSDRAGNTATFRTEIESATSTGTAFQRLPPVDAVAPPSAFQVANSAVMPPQSVATAGNRSEPSQPTSAGWTSSASSTPPPTPAPPTEQPWPPTAVSRAPFRLSTGRPPLAHDNVTAYGNPTLTNEASASAGANSQTDPHGPPARYAIDSQPDQTYSLAAPSADSQGPAFAPLQPYRENSPPQSPFPQPDHSITPDVSPKQVGSRSFALEYDLEESGRWGVTKVEVWGTRDGGQSWRRFAEDDDNRSPLIVTVDEEGLYGFRIVVESTQAAAMPPAPGDTPELWVAVDLQRPVAELIAIEPGTGNMADHLILRWRATDDNLEPRPIALFYSSRPTGPWSAVATNLENTGQYAWRVERHVPARFYLRLEARDTAGNLSAFQTREPIEFVPPAPVVRLRDAEPLQPTATGGAPSYR